ncbi:hypothetical protein OESDEN_16918, partial [Oesophagostomum dentatum]
MKRSQQLVIMLRHANSKKKTVLLITLFGVMWLGRGSSYQSPSSASSSRAPFLLPSNLSAYEIPRKKTSLVLDNEHADDM